MNRFDDLGLGNQIRTVLPTAIVVCGDRRFRGTPVPLLPLQISVGHFLAQQQRSLRAEMHALMGQMSGLDHEDPLFGPGHRVQRSIHGVHVSPNSARVLFGDEPRERRLVEINPQLGNELPHPDGVLLLVRSEVSVVFPGMPEDTFHRAMESLICQIPDGRPEEGDPFGIKAAMGFRRAEWKPLRTLGAAVGELDDRDPVPCIE